MQRNIFSPKLKDLNADTLSAFFRQFAQAIFVGSLILLPLLFIPVVAANLVYVKTIFMVVAVYVTIIMVALSLLRSGSLSVYLPLPIVLFWFFIALAMASAFLTNDTKDALLGLNLEVQTVGFMFLLGLIITLGQICVGARDLLLRSLQIFWLVAIIVQLVYLARIWSEASWLSFGVLANTTNSLVGGLNDLAIFAGLTLLMIVTLVQTLVRTWLGKTVAGVLTALALLVLAIVNFSAIWLVVGFVSLLTFLYLLSKDTWLKNANPEVIEPPVSRLAMSLVALMCLVSGSFIVSGDYLGSKFNTLTEVNYLEVRPASTATLDILRLVYSTDAFLGTGPNRFEDAWRLYKNPAINETMFWNTNFSSGSGYVVTLFVTTGLFGGLAFMAFILSLIYFGYRTLVYTKDNDPTWYKITLVSIVSTSYLWLVLFIYTPGPTILILTAGLTGILLAVYTTIRATATYKIDVTHNRHHGLLLIAGVLMVIIVSTSGLITLGKQFAAHVKFNEASAAVANSGNFSNYDLALEKAQNLYEQDVYVAERARLRLAELNRLLLLSEANSSDEQSFQALYLEGVQLANQAVTLDSSNPFNQALLGSFYGLLDPNTYEGMDEQRDAAFNEAKRLDPQNPEYYAVMAQLVTRYGQLDQARENLVRSIQIKPNYTEGLFLLVQLDVQAGNTEAAVESARAIVRIEPQNPARYFQLGLLEAANGQPGVAAEAYRTAISLDQNYANARYLLALLLIESGQTDEALEQLRVVALSNDDNQELQLLITELAAGNFMGTTTSLIAPVREGSNVSQQDETILVDESPTTDLLAPLNSPLGRSGTSSTVNVTEITNNESSDDSDQIE